MFNREHNTPPTTRTVQDKTSGHRSNSHSIPHRGGQQQSALTTRTITESLVDCVRLGRETTDRGKRVPGGSSENVKKKPGAYNATV
jgi:hypothetical protein